MVFSRRMLQPGETVASYRVVRLLGKGGMGIVYLATHVALERHVALKVLRRDVSDDPEAATRFFTEARAVNRIGHQNIVDVTDFGTTSTGQCFFAMELLTGESLAGRLSREGALSLRRTLHVAVQVADAVAASHAAGIVHRDLKPNNIFLIERERDLDYVKLLDFGLAKLTQVDGGAIRTTLDGAVVGTPAYMSPEQCLGRKDVDHRTDIYALGVILYETIAGRLPFIAEGIGEYLFAHAT
jgi:eukaryotic-like serine/threonine-protein kinase